MAKYMKIKKASIRLGMKWRTLTDWCQRGEVEGATKEPFFGAWIIPLETIEKMEADQINQWKIKPGKRADDNPIKRKKKEGGGEGG